MEMYINMTVDFNIILHFQEHVYINTGNKIQPGSDYRFKYSLCLRYYGLAFYVLYKRQVHLLAESAAGSQCKGWGFLPEPS